MRTTMKSTLLALALIIPGAGAWTVANQLLVLHAQSRVWIDGTSSIKRFSCKADEVNAVVEANGANPISALLTGDKGVKAVRVTIPAARLDCGNDTMNDHMRKALKVSVSPTIDFRLTSYDVARNADGIAGSITGTLALGGVTKTITLKADGKPDGEMLHITGAHEINMKDYDLKPPKLMFGRIKVGDKVTVNFDLLLKS